MEPRSTSRLCSLGQGRFLIYKNSVIIVTFFPGGSDGKASACSVGDPGSIPGLGRSPGEGNGNPLQYSCLENSMDWVAWCATVHGVAKSRTQLSNFTFAFPELWGDEMSSSGIAGEEVRAFLTLSARLPCSFPLSKQPFWDSQYKGVKISWSPALPV